MYLLHARGLQLDYSAFKLRLCNSYTARGNLYKYAINCRTVLYDRRMMAEAAKPRVLVLGGEHTRRPTARFTNEVGIISPFSSVTFNEASFLCCRFLLLFTGVGFIGRNFVKYLVDDGLASKVRCASVCTSAFVSGTTAPVWVWCGVVWCGVVWWGVVWCGVTWCGVVWCGEERWGVVRCGVMWCSVVRCGMWCSCCYCFKDVHVTSYSHVSSCCSLSVYVTVQSVGVQLPVCTWCVQCVAQKSTRRRTRTHCFLINSTLLCTQNDHIFHTGKPHMWVHFDTWTVLYTYVHGPPHRTHSILVKETFRVRRSGR